ncbi:endolytic transglycosylase MltG [Rickettsiaceae bacterium]|nr:endolytic transglycosylase MltG [Rickettsiaceae bacterium]
MKRVVKIKLFIALTVSVLAISVSAFLVPCMFLPGELNEEKVIVIKSGMTIGEISSLLLDEKVIKHDQVFEIVSHIYSYYSPLKSGEYKLTKHITPYQVMRKLAIGKSVIHRLFIPEGSTVHEIIDILNNNERLIGKISRIIPEGYLMPSTYHYSYGDQREHIISQMRKNMSTTLSKVMLKLPLTSPLKTRKDILTLASIIEKEAGNNEEKSKVAAVFINRLKKGMKLQADPTTIYAITEGKYKLERPLNRKDLNIKSPYNTYYIYGLPKGPISCPSKTSLEATINPAKIDDLYFVVNGCGGHNFSKTLKEHNSNIQKFKEKRRSKKNYCPNTD